MKRAVRLINNFFILIVLTIFYFVVIGFTFLLNRLVEFAKRRPKASYWQKAKINELVRDYFTSAY